MIQKQFTGGCFCGAIRFKITGPFGNCASCHCLDCRRISGAPLLTFVDVPSENYEIISGAPATIQYADGVKKRTFCGSCGTPLTYANSQFPDQVDVTVCSLNNPEAFSPSYHVWNKRRLSWLKLEDGLPVFKEFRRE